MSAKTTNYNLVLPEQEEYYDVDVFNGNNQIIDEEIKKVSDRIGALASVAQSGSYNDLADKPNLAAVATSGSYTDLSDKPTLAAVAASGSYNDLADKPNTGAGVTICTINQDTFSEGLTTSEGLPCAIVHQCFRRAVIVSLLYSAQKSLAESCGLKIWSGSANQGEVEVIVNDTSALTADIKLAVVDLGAYDTKLKDIEYEVRNVAVKNYDEAVKKLVKEGVVSTREYWDSAVKCVKYLDTLIINMANRL